MANLKFFLALVMLYQEAASYTRYAVYEHDNFEGAWAGTYELDDSSFVVFIDGLWRTISSYRITAGSCMEIHTTDPPSTSDPSTWFWTMTLDSPSMPSGFDDRLATLRKCGNSTKTIHCPTGTFVKKIQWDQSTMLRNGVELQCFLPKSLTPSATLRSHGSGTLSGSLECTGVRAINYSYDGRRRADVGLLPVCTATTPEKLSGSFRCGPKAAVLGLSMDIENHTGFIKYSNVYCRDVGDIESISAAHDKRSVLFTCDASTSFDNLKCNHAKAVGYGSSTSMSQEQRRELAFYMEFGFGMGSTGFGLSANFRTNLGQSKTTEYSWDHTQESTFNEQINMTIEAEAPAGCVTQVSEVIGECSFIQVRPYYFQRHGTCNNATFITD